MADKFMYILNENIISGYLDTQFDIATNQNSMKVSLNVKITLGTSVINNPMSTLFELG